MNDDEAQRLLAGIDAPRALPDSLHAELLGSLTEATVLTAVDGPRPIPDDLRHRLEASLMTAGARPVPPSLRRRVLQSTTRPTQRLLGAVAAVLLIFVAGVVVATWPDKGAEKSEVAHSAAGGSTTAGGTRAPREAAGDTASQFDSNAGSGAAGSAAPVPQAEGATASATKAVAAPITIAVLGSGDTDIARGFDAYIDAINATGGVDGHVITTATGGAAVATVNLGDAPASKRVDGVLFETAFVEDARLRGSVVSLSSPIERQAHLAVAHAFPSDSLGNRAAIYVSDGPVWKSAADAFQTALEARHVTVTRVGVSQVPDVPGVDAGFLALSPTDFKDWIGHVRTAPARGLWGVGSSYDDGAAGSFHDLKVLSPYQPIDGAEATELTSRTERNELSAGAIHGWVTAKAIVELLRRNGGTTITAADLDRLVGWNPLWAPSFEVRPGTRARTPEAVLLAPKTRADPRYVPNGSFERDP